MLWGRVLILTAAAGLLTSWPVLAYEQNVQRSNSSELPEEFEGVGIEPQLGKPLDLSIPVTKADGETVTLAEFYKKGKPVILSPVYYNCPSLCNFHLDGLVESLKALDWQPGREFEVVAFSFDARETPAMAAKKRERYLQAYGRKETASGWHFVTASEQAVTRLTENVGFSFKWNEQKQEWAHASAAIVTSPSAVISRYLYGIVFQEKDLKLALNEAADGKIGSMVDRLLLFCFRFDPEKNKYTLYAFNVMRAGGAVMVFILLIWLIPSWLRSRREST